MSKYEFDLSDCRTPEEIHRAIGEKLSLPEYYGGNLDALYDVLTDPHDPWHLVFRGLEAAKEKVGVKYMSRFEKMCRRATENSADVKIEFEVSGLT